ncbi:mitotic checkpoint protein-domain-containing protein [Ochromonadaceae sp. CCMP2298]|nr:mitotic checkpoint protein-domain-containing protein [Ochromonadaceae sp. CCMP2298]|mmetsp:Transcript_7065/g.15446  ORF Transcript_7065/g.15446 Transcript_7065/m.15446 type:complete len:746 (+) Transcript_7065:132-2369(+)
MSTEYGEDYSFLLQSLEAQISENIPAEQNELSVTSPYLSSSSVKRRRTGENFSPEADNMFSSASKMRSQAVVDELTLENERLRDQLERGKSEFQASKEELVRQVKFYEEKSSKLKRESQERLDKYYEEKKKWAAKQRELEGQLKKATEKPAAPSASSSQAAGLSRVQEEVAGRLKVLEGELSSKVAEARANMTAKLRLESKLFEAEQELRQLRSTCGEGSMSNEALQEARVLRGQFSQLESAHRRMGREHDAMKKKYRNQTLLEEELSSVKAKLRIAEETLNAHKHVQVEHRQLTEERLLWAQLFQDVVAQSQGNEDLRAALADNEAAQEALHSGGTGVTPTAVLYLLSAYQQRCALLLRGQGQLQQSLGEMRRQMRQAQSQQQAAEGARSSAEEEKEKLRSQLRSVQQQGKLYAGEVTSLRALLETFDTEFRIGKPEGAKMLDLKEGQIQHLRGDLDSCRGEASRYADELRAALGALEECQACVGQLQGRAKEQEERAAVSAAAGRGEDGSAVLREKLGAARSDLEYLQHFTGLDFVPGRTRVLHLTQNPAAHAPAPLPCLPSTVPSVEALQSVARQLQAALRERERDVSQEGEDSSHSHNQSMNMSVMHDQAHAPPQAPHPSQQQQLVDSAKLNLRLKELFKERISSFREAVYLLTGFRMDLYAADPGVPDSLPRLRLRSMFAEKPEDCLLFQLRGDAPELMDTQFAATLDPRLLDQLRTSNSVPLFLATVTQEMFEAQTFMG